MVVVNDGDTRTARSVKTNTQVPVGSDADTTTDRAASARELPFTGFPAVLVALLGMLVFGLGLGIRQLV